MPKDLNPTDEQRAAIDAFASGADLILEAGAGTGKTSTLRLMAEATKDRGVYVAYNRAIADEAKARFPRNVRAATAHSFAFRDVGYRYKDRLNGDRQPLWKVAKFLGIDAPLAAGDRRLSESTLARLTMEMVGHFCNSADPRITTRHRPYVEGLRGTDASGAEYDYHDALGRELLPYAEKAWDDLCRDDETGGGTLRFAHDHYLKMWQLGDPDLGADYVLFDEAQDANPVIADIVRRQAGAQRVMVGDRAQAIYGWRGAIDAMDGFGGGVPRLYLSQSFRFGPAIAEQANLWLARLDTPLRLTGLDSIPSTVERCPDPRAILCRTNVGALAELLFAQQAGINAHMVGGGTDVAAFCKGVVDLQTRGSSTHRDLIAFSSWEEVRRYVKEDEKAGDLATWVSIVDRYGTQVVLDAVERMEPNEARAALTISTAHKAKGREWSSVRIAEDFASGKVDPATGEIAAKPLTPEGIMLRYVAVTRAMNTLDPGPLAQQVNDEDAPLDVVGVDS